MLTILLHALSIPSAAVSDTRLTESFVYGCLQPYMPTYSVRASGDLAEEIEAFADAYEGSRSDALRELLRRGTAYEDIHRDRDRLRNAQTQLIEQREENQELVEYVETERAVREHEADREQRRRSANVLRRAWWFVAGEPEPEPDSERADAVKREA